ncbi:hypothetical protein DDQ68_09155 [Hymenobacter nivis]|uniref:Transmembrane protein n=2 Tax=Hymenobacter nivis TaxID=1850093 RepID=A0A2Z3GKQ9_9BACT|nr:hypothetical protein DDQ68_09155 [Hymenobacter nivis]
MANLPFARILGAVFMGGNDEVYALSKFLPYHRAWALGGRAGAAGHGAAAGAGLGGAGRPWVFLAFFLLPFPFAAAMLLGALNSLLASGFLATGGLLGAPLLITCWTAAVGAALALTYRYLFALGQPIATPPPPPTTFKP